MIYFFEKKILGVYYTDILRDQRQLWLLGKMDASAELTAPAIHAIASEWGIWSREILLELFSYEYVLTKGAQIMLKSSSFDDGDDSEV